MPDGRDVEKVEQKEEESSSSTWADIARDVALSVVLGGAGYGVSKAIAEDVAAKGATKAAEDAGRTAAEMAMMVATMGIGGAAGLVAAKGATLALKAGEKSEAKAEESTLDKVFNFYKAVHCETLPFYMLGPLAMIPQCSEPIKKADGLVLDKVKSVSETMFERARKDPMRFAAMTVASPLIPVLDAIIND